MIINGNCFDIQPHSPNKLLQEMYENIKVNLFKSKIKILLMKHRDLLLNIDKNIICFFFFFVVVVVVVVVLFVICCNSNHAQQF